MKKVESKSQQRKREKRERILRQAITLFSRNGYSQTTISNVAQASGVSFGTVFTYFSSKEELFNAAVLEPLEEWKTILLDVPDKGISPLKQIKQMIQGQVRLFAREADYLRLLQYVLGQYERFSDLFGHLDDFLIRFQVAMKPLILKGQDCGELEVIEPDLVSLSYISFLTGIRLTLIESFRDEVWEMFMNQALRLFGPLK